MPAAVRLAPGVLFLCLGIARQVAAQQYAFKQFTPLDGLAQSQVRAMAQDGRGYLWFGTLGGVSRFDGHFFADRSVSDGLPDPHVSAMVTDATGTLWMASGSSLVRVFGGRLVSEPLPLEGETARIMALAATTAGAIIAGTDGAGLYLRDTKGTRRMTQVPDSATHVRALLALRDGRLLVGLRNGLLVCNDAGCTWVGLPGAQPVAVSALAEAPDGAWWVGTYHHGLFRLTPGGGVGSFGEDRGLLRDNIRCLVFDDRGRLWVGTKLGLNVHENGRMRTITVHQGMPNDNVWCALKDREGNLWFGTDGGGVLRYAGDRFVTFTVKDGLCSDLVMCTVADAHDDLWLGTYDNGICRLDGMAMVNTVDGLPNNTVWCGLRSRSGALWFGTSDGLARVERGVVKPLPGPAALPGQRVLALLEDRQGHLWCGTRDGVQVVDPEGRLLAQHRAGPPSGPGRSVRSILQDGRGVLWFATEQGVVRFDGKSFARVTQENSLPANTVSCLALDARQRLWMGTTNGLACLADGRVHHLRLAQDFGTNHVNLLVNDGRGRLWCGTNNGLFVFHPDSLLLNPANHRQITLSDGLRAMEFNLNAGFVDARGRLFLGTTGGLVFHDPTRNPVQDIERVPPVYITGLRSFLLPTDWRDRCDSLDADGLPRNLRLDYRRNHLTFDFTAIDLGRSGRLLFRHRLLGVDEDWLPPTDARFASYSDLRNGSYTFQVSASVAGGPWSEPASFTFRVEPPFWLRGWFFAAAAVGLLAAVVAIHRVRRVRRERIERTRHLMLRSRMLQLEQQALNANMNRHFVFNALNSIQYHINRQDRTTASRYLTSFARLIRKNLDASQEDTTTLAEELERVQLYLELEHMRFKERFTYAVHVDPAVDPSRVRLPAMMLQPYVENSIWHGILPMDRPGCVTIAVEPADHGHIMVRIDDDGLGVERSKAGKQTAGAGHISRGIEITKGRADVLRRLAIMDIRISGPQQRHDPRTGQVLGTRVELLLPLQGEERPTGPGNGL